MISVYNRMAYTVYLPKKGSISSREKTAELNARNSMNQLETKTQQSLSFFQSWELAEWMMFCSSAAKRTACSQPNAFCLAQTTWQVAAKARRHPVPSDIFRCLWSIDVNWHHQTYHKQYQTGDFQVISPSASLRTRRTPPAFVCSLLWCPCGLSINKHRQRLSKTRLQVFENKQAEPMKQTEANRSKPCVLRRTNSNSNLSCAMQINPMTLPSLRCCICQKQGWRC